MLQMKHCVGKPIIKTFSIISCIFTSISVWVLFTSIRQNYHPSHDDVTDNLKLTNENHRFHDNSALVVNERAFVDNELSRKLNGNNTAEEDPPCSDVLLHQTSQQRCDHARHCDGEYLMQTVLPYAFCLNDATSSPLKSHPTLRVCFPIIFPALLILSIVMLFRLLASTAENYFSPALEMISSEFQIPPPLAGVTLLALGNGSPDVSAVMNAIKANPAEGISLSLGELTGGGMFVQAIVVGRIVSIGRKVKGSDEIRGVLCHAELIRDIAMYTLAATYVFYVCEQDTIYYRHVIFMFVMYLGYVGVVVAFELRRYYTNNDNDGSSESIVSDVEPIITSDNALEELLQLSVDGIQVTCSQDEEDYATLERSTTHEKSPAQRARDPPGSKHSARIIRVIKIQEERQRKKRMQRRFQQGSRRMSKPHDFERLQDVDVQQRVWSLDLLKDALCELVEDQDLFVDSCWNKDISTIERLLVLLESPFVVLRKLVTPLPCEGDYNRSMVALSIALSPAWLSAYLAFKKGEFDPFRASLFWTFSLSIICGCLVIRYAPKGNTTMPLRYTVPVALYGFFIAATWIDVISDQLINVLEFVGVVLRIPSPIMGLTVLAWGNSVGDYSTNSALARKGFSDMSMAACFAGPSFNLLIGLGSGLLSQKDALMSDDGLNIISMAPSVRMGFVFLIANCILGISIGIYNKGILPIWFANTFFAMYLCYMTMNAQLFVS